MAYSSDMLSKRVTLLMPHGGEWRDERARYTLGPTVWGAVDWARGARALRQGEITAYQSVMVRVRWRSDLSPRVRLLVDGKFYAVDSFNADRRANTVQMVCAEVPPFPYSVPEEEAGRT